mmetsp:Transcript_41063/g.88617  ORF Transcript_41063/g.88617 Transcript_41063/m.88617 type:complete len:218 (+) Transcript_41063:721-1374(+)
MLRAPSQPSSELSLKTQCSMLGPRLTAESTSTVATPGKFELPNVICRSFVASRKPFRVSSTIAQPCPFIEFISSSSSSVKQPSLVNAANAPGSKTLVWMMRRWSGDVLNVWQSIDTSALLNFLLAICNDRSLGMTKDKISRCARSCPVTDRCSVLSCSKDASDCTPSLWDLGSKSMSIADSSLISGLYVRHSFKDLTKSKTCTGSFLKGISKMLDRA